MSRRPTITLFAGALIVRIIVLFTGPWAEPSRIYTFSPDSPRYVALADTLRDRHTFGKRVEDGLMHRAVEEIRRKNGTLPAPDANGLSPEAFRTPGYPCFLAAFGGTSGLRSTYLVQCGLGALAALCLVRVALGLGSRPRAALAAGWLWALHPAVVIADVLPLTESLFSSLSLFGLAAVVRMPTPAGRLIPGLLIGAAALVRPLGLLYLPTALILGWRRTRRKWFAAAVTVLIAAIPSAFWAARNAAAGNGARVSTVGDMNLYFYGAAYVISESRGEDWFTSWPTRVDELARELAERVKSGEDVFAHARNAALADLAARPGATARVAVKSQVKLGIDHSAELAAGLYGVQYQPSGFFSNLLSGEFAPSRISAWALVAIPWVALNALVLLLAAYGVVRCARRRLWPLLFGCLVPVVLFSIASFPVGLERFRIPFMPFLFVLAAAAVWMPERTATHSTNAG